MSESGDSAMLWADRYGGANAPPRTLDLNPILEQLLAHKSVRAYLPSAVPAGTLEAVMAAAQSASTSANLQAWSVVAVEDPARKARLADLSGNQAHIRQCPLFLVWLADLARLDQAAAAQGVKAEGLDFLESFLVAVIDATLAAQNAVVALESLGLACVYIGGIRNQIEAVAAELGLPAQVFPVFGLCIGFENTARPATVKPRLAQEAVVHREQYGLSEQVPAVQNYDAVMAAFYASQGMKPALWSQHSIDRVLTPAALNGREHLAAALHRLGFGLR
jgi:nitroreductase